MRGVTRGRAPFCILLWGAILSSFLGKVVYADNVVLNVGIGPLVIHKADNLWAYGKSTIASLTDEPSAVTMVLPNPSFEAGYNSTRANTEYYVIVSMDEPGYLTLGAEKKLPNGGSIDFYGFYSMLAREWKNPYVLNRETTHSDEFGFKASCENIADYGLVLSYKLTAKMIGQDDIGALYPELKRDGVIHNATIGYRIFPFFEPGVTFERGIFEGKSNSYRYGEFYLGLAYQNGNFTLGARTFAGRGYFDQEHPVFGKSRKENHYGIDLMGKTGKPFNLARLSIIFGITTDRTHSNIPFFEQKEQQAWVGLEYSLAGI